MYKVTYCDCLRCITLITTEITSPITAIANNVTKTMITALLSSEPPSPHAPTTNSNIQQPAYNGEVASYSGGFSFNTS